MDIIIEYFSKDPLKILYFFGGAGGIWFWFEKWKYRLRFELVELTEEYNPIDHNTDVTFKMSCRNLGKTKTSLRNIVKVEGYFGASELKRFSGSIRLTGNALSLPSHEIQEFSGRSRFPASYCFQTFKKYKITSTIGSNKTVYYLGYKNQSTAVVWYFSLLMFRLFNRRPKYITNMSS